MHRTLLSLALLLMMPAACTSGSTGMPAGSVGDTLDGGLPAGWTLMWSDEFDGAQGGAADSSNWTYDVGNGGWGNNELEYYRRDNANAALDGNGDLVITAKAEAYGGSNYTSARLKTAGKITWTYGRIEARMKLPAGQGMWPAFWMLGDDIGRAGWPACGEVDIMENLGREPFTAHGTMHGPGYSGAAGPTAPYTLPGGGKFADGFHVFAIEWELNVIRWYVDGNLYSTKTPAAIAGNTWVFDHPFFIILNVAVGGGWPGNPDGTTVFPQTMVVDYVRVYQR
jgi:beta-glucanase (GH16 family)